MAEVTFFFKKNNRVDLFYGKIIFTSKEIFETNDNLNQLIRPYILQSINWVNKVAEMPPLRLLTISVIGLIDKYQSDIKEESSNGIFDLHIVCYDDNSLIINGYSTISFEC